MDRQKEIKVVAIMIYRYCKGKHSSKRGQLCQECSTLLEYVKLRRDRCPHGDNKPFCANCKIHCYKADMRAKIRDVMRYSGPRIIWSHPILALKHLIESKREKKRITNASRERHKE